MTYKVFVNDDVEFIIEGVNSVVKVDDSELIMLKDKSNSIIAIFDASNVVMMMRM